MSFCLFLNFPVLLLFLVHLCSLSNDRMHHKKLAAYRKMHLIGKTTQSQRSYTSPFTKIGATPSPVCFLLRIVIFFTSSPRFPSS